MQVPNISDGHFFGKSQKKFQVNGGSVGDLNSITTTSEKCGGSRTFPSLASNEKKETMAQCNFFDLGFSGSNFT